MTRAWQNSSDLVYLPLVDQKVPLAYHIGWHLESTQGMKFGLKIRATRIARGMTQQELARRMNVSVSYISKVENGRLHFGDYPSEKFIHRLAAELGTDEDDLLMLADKIPIGLRKIIREHPSLFRAIAVLDAKALNELASDLTGKLILKGSRRTS